MKVFEKAVKIRFGHTDPAGIMFYPRYFELLNAVVEDWFEEALGVSFGCLLGKHNVGAPLGDIQSRFMKPCRLGERLVFRLEIFELGRTTVKLQVSTMDGEELRVRSKLVLVCARKDMSGAANWPNPLHDRMKDYLMQETCA